MDFLINENELAALYGLPHIQQLTYLRGIRPYMDVKTGMVGIKRKISHQSISEQLYIEPHPGIKSESFSRGQVRRALASLERAGLIEMQSEDLQLILKCKLATLGYSVQNKAGINPTYQAGIEKAESNAVNTRVASDSLDKADIVEIPKADPPLINNNYLYLLLSQFEQFWLLYPEKKGRQKAWAIFQELNPDEALFKKIMQALTAEINNHKAKEVQGLWTPPWKYPTNWLIQRCWEDEITTVTTKEIQHAKHRKNTNNKCATDWFCPPTSEDEYAATNIITFKQHR